MLKLSTTKILLGLSQNKTQKIIKAIGIITLLTFIATASLLLSYFTLSDVSSFLAIQYIIIFIAYFAISPFETLGTTKEFLKKTCLLFTLVTLGLLMLQEVLKINITVLYFLICVTLTLLWSVISYIAKNSMATIINEVISIVAGIIIFIKDSLIEFIAIGSWANKIQLTTDLIFLPIIVINGVGTIVCIIKKYRIDKYQNGIDPFEQAYEIWQKQNKTDNQTNNNHI